MPTKLEQYTLGRELGSGVSCKVKLAKDESDTRYAIKIFRQDANFGELVQTEVDTLNTLNHPNIVKLVEVGEGTQIHSKKGQKRVKYIVLELVAGGELFDFIALGGALDEPTARFYYKQILDGLGYMHKSGIVHRDLKPENIMLDRNFNVKIADFGFAAPSMGRDGSGMLETQLGTASYMAPEIHVGSQYDGKAVDLFATAIILFVALTQRPPFASANPNDPHYSMIGSGIRENMDAFWGAHAEASQGDIYSPEFKDLFEKLMSINPANRPTTQEILQHPWMKGTTASYDEIREEFKERKALIDQDAAEKRDQKRTERRDAKERIDQEVHRGSASGEENQSSLPCKMAALKELEVPDFDTYVQKTTRFFTSGDPQEYMMTLLMHLKEQDVPYKISENSLKVNFTTQLLDEDEEGEEEVKSDTRPPRDAKLSVRIFKCQDEVNLEKYCVDFSYADPATKADLSRDDRISYNFTNYRDNVKTIAPWFNEVFVHVQ